MSAGGVVGGWDIEDLVAYMLYPKVFVDFLTKINETSPVLTLLPSTMAISGMEVGSSFQLPADAWDWVFSQPKASSEEEKKDEEQEGATTEIRVELKRIGGIMKENRKLLFQISSGDSSETQEVTIKDNGDGDGFTFTGQMADGDNEGHVPSPMRGVIDTIMVAVGDEVEAGQTLLVVSAMKVEVNIPFGGFGDGEGGVVSNILMEEGDNVVEGALLIEVSPRS
jgi:pyruvate carboxylase